MPLYRPEVGAYLANQRIAGTMFAHSLHDRPTDGTATATAGRRGPAWLRAAGQWTGSTSSDAGLHVTADGFLLHGGAELAHWPPSPAGGALHIGVMAAYGQTASHAGAAGNAAHARGNVEGWQVGAYGTWYQHDDSRLGAYIDGWLGHGWFRQRVEGDRLPSVHYDGSGWNVSAEAGYALPLAAEWIVQPQVQWLYASVTDDDITEASGTRVQGTGSHGVMTRLGVRIARSVTMERNAPDGGTRRLEPSLTFNWWHGRADGGVSFNQVPVGSLFPSSRYEVKLGLDAALGRRWTGWAHVAGSWGANDFHQAAVRAGVTYAW